MIYDKLDNLETYAAISERLTKGLQLLRERDLSALEPGRYEMDGDNMTLYEESTYTRVGTGEGVVGTWTQSNGWSYVFTENGEFSEEGIFYGHYTVEEANSRIKLMYDDPIEDAYLYYTLDGDKLTVAYPWPMVRVQ